MKTLMTTLLLTTIAATANADSAGLQISQVEMPHHNSAARVATWYPTATTAEPTLYADNAVFQGVPAHMNADIKEGQYPVVMFSHGMGGTDRAQAWLAAGLAERGIITVVLNHTNSTWGNFDMSKGVAHWTRAQDMQVALDVLLSDPAFAGNVDMTQVMAAGFSFGGWTALSLGGAVGNHAGTVQTCMDNIDMVACEMLLTDEVNIQGVDPEVWNASYADARITHVTAIDPGLVWGLDASNVDALLPSPLMIGFGGDQDRMSATDFDQSGLAGLLNEPTIVQFEPAYHFSAMPVCTDRGEMILEMENDDPVCTDPEGSDRAEIHAEIIDLIAGEFGL